MIKKYRVKRDCYFGRLWLKGEMAEFADDVKVPEHFEPYKTKFDRLAEKMGENATATKKLEDMTVFELRSLAKNNGIELEKNATKENIIAAIRGE